MYLTWLQRYSFKYINEKVQSDTNIKILGENTAFSYFGGQSRVKAVLKGNKTQTL